MSISDEQAKKLRKPFPKDQIGKLPKPTKRDNPKGKCQECGGWHGLPAVHLDYVGHAATTDRLLEVDPSWTWEFLAANQDGSPVVYTNGLSDGALGIWIKVRIADVWTPGFGEGKNFKEAISDAIRNAAMRRGVALDLWSKEDLHAEEGEPKPAGAQGERAGSTQRKPAAKPAAAASSPSEVPEDLKGSDDPVEQTISRLTGEILSIAKRQSGELFQSTTDVLAKKRGETADALDYVKWLERQHERIIENYGTPEGSPFQVPAAARRKQQRAA